MHSIKLVILAALFSTAVARPVPVAELSARFEDESDVVALFRRTGTGTGTGPPRLSVVIPPPAGVATLNFAPGMTPLDVATPAITPMPHQLPHGLPTPNTPGPSSNLHTPSPHTPNTPSPRTPQTPNTPTQESPRTPKQRSPKQESPKTPTQTPSG